MSSYKEMSSYFYLHGEKESKSAKLIEELETHSKREKKLIYLLKHPLVDKKYKYHYRDVFILLSPGHKITFINYGESKKLFEEFIEDVVEDIASISDKYLYKEVIGRPRQWRADLIYSISYEEYNSNRDTSVWLNDVLISDEESKRRLDLLISLFIGSINDVEKIKLSPEKSVLDRVKQKIQLFDAEQTRFIYKEEKDKKRITVQGLSGTGKTELLLHKLKELYTEDEKSKIYFTCHNKILADKLRKRIPEFFNFMKVEQQIKWEERLWCTNAWGSGTSPNSGAYRYICEYYKIPFYTYAMMPSFSKACELALQHIKLKYSAEDSFKKVFTYMLIDESQDFDENFFTLCNFVTEKQVYIAGDIFQNIFDEHVTGRINSDYLLGKCYRTDPKTLMFAHAMGMGLFEEKKIRWLEEEEWRGCGYNVEIKKGFYHLSREPLRRFEDVADDFESIKVTLAEDGASDIANVRKVIQIIKEIRREHPTVKPDDIGVILLDSSNDIYKYANLLSLNIFNETGWKANKAYETKENIADSILISNRNNVKGLEFAFVICITKVVRPNIGYRNLLYTMLTRSFIRSYLFVLDSKKPGLTKSMAEGYKRILKDKEMVVKEPTNKEKELISMRFKISQKRLSFYDIISELFRKYKIKKEYQPKLRKAAEDLELMDADEEIIERFILNTYTTLSSDGYENSTDKKNSTLL